MRTVLQGCAILCNDHYHKYSGFTVNVSAHQLESIAMEESWIAQSLRAIISDLNDDCCGNGITLEAAEGYKW